MASNKDDHNFEVSFNVKELYIFACLISLLLLTGFNSFFFISKNALGYDFGSFLFTSDDRFADLIKVALSYKKVLLHIPNIDSVIEKLDPIYQNYYYHNPYGGIENLAIFSHFHITSISTFLSLIVGISIGSGLTPRFVLWTIFIVCLLLSYFSTLMVVNKTSRSALAMLALILFSYPLLFIVTRANYSAFFCGIGVIAFLNSLFTHKNVDLLSAFLYAVAVNFRPNAIILLLALPLILKIRDSILPAMRIVLFSALIYAIIYFIVHKIYPDYTLSAFLQALSVYNKMYIIGEMGNSFNSSLYGALKMIGCVFSLNYNVIYSMFCTFSLLLLSNIGLMILLKDKIDKIDKYMPFLLSSMYILLNPVSGDYHLLIFVVPVFLIYTHFEDWKEHKTELIVITISTLLILAPKNYIYTHGISLQVIINPLIMLSTSIFLIYKIYRDVLRVPKHSHNQQQIVQER